MYLFIFPAKDLRDDLKLLKSKSHDISGEKILHKKCSEKISIMFLVIKSNLNFIKKFVQEKKCFLKNHDFFSLLVEFVWSWKTITITKSFFNIFSFFKGNILCSKNYDTS